MISYCSIPLPLNTPELDSKISEGVDLSQYRPMPNLGTSQHAAPGFYQFKSYDPPPVKIGQLTWPTDIDAWATAYYIIDDATYTRITNVGYVDGNNGVGYFTQSNILLLDDGEDRFACTMYVHRFVPVAQNAYLMVLVDDRFYKNAAEDNVFPVVSVTTGDPVTYLKGLVNYYNPFAVSIDADVTPTNAYRDLWSTAFTHHWRRNSDPIPRHTNINNTGGQVSNRFHSDTEDSGYSYAQMVLNVAMMLGYRAIVLPSAFDYDAFIGASDPGAKNTVVLRRPDGVLDRDNYEIDRWKHKAVFGRQVPTNRAYPGNAPLSYGLVGARFTGVVSVSGGVAPDTPDWSDADRPFCFYNPSGATPSTAGNGTNAYYSATQTSGRLIADVEKQFSANISDYSKRVALVTQAGKDSVNWAGGLGCDLTYAGVVPFSLHGSVSCLTITHTSKVFVTKVAPHPPEGRYSLLPVEAPVNNFTVFCDTIPYSPPRKRTTTGRLGTTIQRLNVSPSAVPQTQVFIRGSASVDVTLDSKVTPPTFVRVKAWLNLVPTALYDDIPDPSGSNLRQRLIFDRMGDCNTAISVPVYGATEVGGSPGHTHTLKSSAVHGQIAPVGSTYTPDDPDGVTSYYNPATDPMSGSAYVERTIGSFSESATEDLYTLDAINYDCFDLYVMVEAYECDADGVLGSPYAGALDITLHNAAGSSPLVAHYVRSVTGCADIPTYPTSPPPPPPDYPSSPPPPPPLPPVTPPPSPPTSPPPTVFDWPVAGTDVISDPPAGPTPVPDFPITVTTTAVGTDLSTLIWANVEIRFVPHPGNSPPTSLAPGSIFPTANGEVNPATAQPGGFFVQALYSGTPLELVTPTNIASEDLSALGITPNPFLNFGTLGVTSTGQLLLAGAPSSYTNIAVKFVWP